MIMRGDQLIALEWSLVAFTFLLVLLRLYARWKLRGTISSWQDFFATISWFCFVAETAIDTRLNQLGFFRPSINALEDSINVELGSVEALKLLYTEGATYPLCMYAVKAAMLCFYSHIIPFTMRKTRIVLWVTTFYVAIGFLAGLFVALFACQPVPRNWSISEANYCGSAWTAEAGIVLPSFFHLSSDILLYALPLPILRVLSLPTKQKIGIGVTFALGFLCVFFAVCVLAANYFSPYLVTGWFFAALEQTWAVCVVCAPAFKLFLTRDLGGLLKRWRSKVSSTVGTMVSTSGNRRVNSFHPIDGQNGSGGSRGTRGSRLDEPAFDLGKMNSNGVIGKIQRSQLDTLRWNDVECGYGDDISTAATSPNSSKAAHHQDDDAIEPRHDRDSR